MEISVVFQSIAIITVMIVIGAILSRTFPFNDDTRNMFISLIVNVAMPCIILSSIFNVKMEEDTFKMIALVFCLSIIINVLGIGIGWFFATVFYRNSNKKNELALLSGLGNTGFIGIPLCATLLGPQGALYAAIFDAGVDLTIWTVGVLMLQKNGKFAFRTLKSMINIPIVAIVAGLTAAYFHVKPPATIVLLIDQLAALAAPLAMFYIGFLIMNVRRSKMRETRFEVILPISVKLLLLPVVAAILMYFIEIETLLVQTVIIQSMMPTLTLASILFARYSADEDMGAVTTVLSTILALSTIPFMIYIMNIFLVN